MNAEYTQQLYGGEISDHFKIQGKLAPEFINSFLNNDQKLGNIYNAQVKPVGHDIQQANDAVLKALEELKSLGEI